MIHGMREKKSKHEALIWIWNQILNIFILTSLNYNSFYWACKIVKQLDKTKKKHRLMPNDIQ